MLQGELRSIEIKNQFNNAPKILVGSSFSARGQVSARSNNPILTDDDDEIRYVQQ